MNAQQRFARLATELVVRRPAFWWLVRGPLRRMFDRVAPHWDERRTSGHLAPLQAALDSLEAPPARALDVGTGTGAAALEIARRWPETEVVGVDISQRMVEQARRKIPPELAGRVSFAVADAAALPYPDGSFDIVTLSAVIPFFDEVARVTAPGGRAVFAFSLGAETPIYVPFERLRAELSRRGFTEFAEFSAGPGTALVARKAESV